ncbi:MAG: hypothetical protein ABSH11_08010 [Verrucomicrobiota bacterium]|jgi:hypothetical protein
MTLDIKNIIFICLRIQPSNKGEVIFCAYPPVGLILLQRFSALKAGDHKMA